MKRISEETPSQDRPQHLIGRIATFGAIGMSVLVLSAAAAGACTTGKGSSDHGKRVSLTSHIIGSTSLKGTIGTIGVSSFTLTSEGGTTSTVTVTPSTVVTEAGSAIAYAKLVAGDKVRVSGSVSSTSPSTFNATAIKVVLAHIKGTVVSASAGTFTVADHHDFWRVVMEGPSTTYFLGSMKLSNPTTVTSIVPGVKVDALGTVDANHTSLDAITVRIALARVTGTVASVTGSSFVVANNGAMTTVSTSTSTVFSSTTPVAVGDEVVALGTAPSSTTLTALYVTIKTPPAHHVETARFNFGEHHHGHQFAGRGHSGHRGHH